MKISELPKEIHAEEGTTFCLMKKHKYKCRVCGHIEDSDSDKYAGLAFHDVGMDCDGNYCTACWARFTKTVCGKLERIDDE